MAAARPANPPRGSDAEESSRDHQAGTGRDRLRRLPDRRSRGIQPQHAEADGGGQQGPERLAGALERQRRPLQHGQRDLGGHQAVRRDRPALAGRSQQGHRDAERAPARLPAARRRHGAAHGRGRGAAGGGARGRRQPLQRPGVEPQPLLRLLEAGLSHHHALARPGAGRDGGSRRAHAPARRVLLEAAGKRAVAHQLPHDQPRRAARDARLQRPQPRARHGQPHARPGEVGRRPQHQPDRRGGLRGRPQHRHLARQGRVPERAHPADPVRAEHRERARDAAADRAALDQQVLHPRPRAAEVVHPLHGRQGLHGVRGVLGQPGRAPQGQDLRGVHDRRPARRHRCRQARDRRPRRST